MDASRTEWGRPSAEGADMTAFGSVQYTIGTALDRARDAGHTVEVLVDGNWVKGAVVANDGQGAVLDHEGREHAVVRLERISAVRVAARAPMLRPVPAGFGAED